MLVIKTVKLLSAIALGAVLLMPAGCGSGERIGKLEKQVAELKAETQKNQAAADFDMQAKCSRDARAYFRENWRADKDTLLLDYTNHYSKKLNKCFIRVVHNDTLSKGFWTSNVVIYDVYENIQYGDISESNNVSFEPAYKDEKNVVRCEVAGTKCTEWDGFNRLIRPYTDD